MQFLSFFASLPLCMPSVRANFGCEWTKMWPRITHTHTRNMRFYILDILKVEIPTGIVVTFAC